MKPVVGGAAYELLLSRLMPTVSCGTVFCQVDDFFTYQLGPYRFNFFAAVADGLVVSVSSDRFFNLPFEQAWREGGGQNHTYA